MRCPTCSALVTIASAYCYQCGNALKSWPVMTPPTGHFQPQALLEGRYLILSKIADGGFSSVYQAKDTRLGDRLVAVKEMVLPPLQSPAEQAQAIADFQREAELLAHISHPNLPRVIDRFQDGGRHFLVMDFIPGQSLRAVLNASSAPISETTVLSWAAQLCDVLQFLHDQSPPIIYRDLKPENVLLQSSGTLSLVDFGIARQYRHGITSDTVPLGTPGYAAPEQFGSSQSDARTDVYTLGVLLFELLTRHDVSANLFQFPPARQFVANISVRTEEALQQALELDPADRFQNMRALYHGLGLGSHQSQPISTATAIPPVSPYMHKDRRSPLQWLLLVSALFSGLVLAGVMLLMFSGRASTLVAGAKTTPSPAPRAELPSEVALTGVPAPSTAVSSDAPASVNSTSVLAPSAAVSSDAPTTQVVPTAVLSSEPTQQFAASPQPSPTLSLAELQAQLEAAINIYNQRRADALRTSDTAIFTEITSGEQYNKEIRTITSDIETGAHHEIAVYSWQMINIEVVAANDVFVTISKNEDRLFFPSGCNVPDDTEPCRREKQKQNTARDETYSVRYHMLKSDDVWKIDRSEVLP